MVIVRDFRRVSFNLKRYFLYQFRLFGTTFTSIKTRKYLICENLKSYQFYNTNFKRCYSTSHKNLKKLDDDYYLTETKSNHDTFLLGVTKNKFKEFKEIVFINFTDEKKLSRGDYLFSVEDSKTLFDFYCPVDCIVEEVNPKFSKGVSERSLKELFDSPEGSDNYLVKVKLKTY